MWALGLCLDRAERLDGATAIVAAHDFLGLAIDGMAQRSLLDPLLGGQAFSGGRFFPVPGFGFRIHVATLAVFAVHRFASFGNPFGNQGAGRQIATLRRGIWIS
jgi:hypothetical protein